MSNAATAAVAIPRRAAEPAFACLLCEGGIGHQETAAIFTQGVLRGSVVHLACYDRRWFELARAADRIGKTPAGGLS